MLIQISAYGSNLRHNGVMPWSSLEVFGAGCRPCEAVVANRSLFEPGVLPLPNAEILALVERIVVLEAANHALRAEAEHASFRFAEVEHRLMNSFGMIRALVSATARPGDTGDDFRRSFLSRLMALAHSHGLLCSGYAQDSTLDEVVRRCLSPHSDDPGRIALAGPPVRLAAQHVPTLGLAFHELATNAAKYGALSVAAGRVEVSWSLSRDTKQEPMVEVLWRECGGPPVRLPERRGFGSLLLERGLDHRRGHPVRLDFAPDGLRCRMWMKLASG